MELEKKLRELVKDWEKRATEQVPEVYSSRGLQGKYFRLDNEAAGLIACAEELLNLLDENME